jgi:hypothetical protein
VLAGNLLLAKVLVLADRRIRAPCRVGLAANYEKDDLW